MHRFIHPRIPGAVAGALLGACTATALAVAILLPAGTATAESDAWFRPVDNPKVKAECGACHMAFPAGMLPARSWEALMAGLTDHFGEDASLDAATRREITDWLVANAARPRSAIAHGSTGDTAPLRITDTPWWIDAHRGEVRPGAFADPRVGSKANCTACHRDAARGAFGDD